MSARGLRDVQGRDVKPEGAHAPDETAHQEISGVPAAVVGQTVGRQLYVGEQLAGILVRVGTALVGRLEPLADLSEEDPVGHAVVARGRKRLRSREQRRVRIDARRQIAVHVDAARALAQRLGELPALVEISRDDELLVTLQGLAYGFAVDIGVPVHIAADPGAEPQDAGHVQRFFRDAERACESGLDFLVEQRHHPIQDLDQVEKDVLALVRHREAFAWMLLGLPDARDVEPHPRPQGIELGDHQRGIEPVEQPLGDVLLLSQDRPPRRLGGMRGEYRLDAHRSDQRERPLERETLALEARDAFGYAAGLQRARVVEVLAAAAHAVNFLGRVHREKPCGEGPCQVGGGRGLAARGPPLQIAVLRDTLAPRDRGPPIPFHEREELVAPLVAQDLADETPQRVHIVAQPQILRRELNAFAVHHGREINLQAAAAPFGRLF